MQGTRDAFWETYERTQAPTSHRVWLKVTTLPGELAVVARAVEAGDSETTLAGCAPVGVLRVGTTDARAATLVETLRDVVARHGGSVVVERGPRDLRTRVGAWGPVEANNLDLMRALKNRFDPTGVLNPGRFVDGI